MLVSAKRVRAAVTSSQVPGAAEIGQRDDEGGFRPRPPQRRFHGALVGRGGGLGGDGFTQVREAVLGRNAEAGDGECGVADDQVGEEGRGGKDAAQQPADGVGAVGECRQFGSVVAAQAVERAGGA
jgi:hypothetical protein